jgi:carbon monoxide dehydrogenase subunit G
MPVSDEAHESAQESAVSIDRPVAAVWELVGAFGGLDTWMPGVDACRVDGDTRILEVFGMEITERLVRRDDAARLLEYTIVQSPLNLTSHLSRIEVHEHGEGSRVTWHVEASPDHLTELLAGTYQQALDAMKARLEAQGG